MVNGHAPVLFLDLIQDPKRRTARRGRCLVDEELAPFHVANGKTARAGLCLQVIEKSVQRIDDERPVSRDGFEVLRGSLGNFDVVRVDSSISR